MNWYYNKINGWLVHNTGMYCKATQCNSIRNSTYMYTVCHIRWTVRAEALQRVYIKSVELRKGWGACPPTFITFPQELDFLPYKLILLSLCGLPDLSAILCHCTQPYAWLLNSELWLTHWWPQSFQCTSYIRNYLAHNLNDYNFIDTVVWVLASYMSYSAHVWWWIWVIHQKFTLTNFPT